jgi:hypothetical protein
LAGEFVVKWACVVVGQPHETVVVAWVRVVVVVKWALEVVGQSSNKSVIVVVHDQNERLGKRRAVVVDQAT